MLPVLRNTRNHPGFAFSNDIDRFFNAALGGSLTGWSPAIDVNESEDEYVLVAELPGMASKDVEVTVENGVLSISGEKRSETDETENGRRVVERRYGSFARTFSLPRSVDGSSIKADLDNGLLTVRLPKAKEAKARRIKIGS